MNKNQNSTRFFSEQHENSICNALNGVRQPNSGAGRFRKGDVVVERASLLIEAKTPMSEKESFSIKKEWIEKNKEEAFELRKVNSSICFRFEPQGKNYYIINESLMKFLVESLAKDGV